MLADKEFFGGKPCAGLALSRIACNFNRGQAAKAIKMGVGKVFGLGFQKTGTSSLQKALRILDYRVHGWFGVNGPRQPRIGEPITKAALLEVALQKAEGYDAFADNPWCLLYRDFDRLYPGSKFILTIRDAEAWFESVARHFDGKSSPMMEHVYGVSGPPRLRKARFIERYVRHNEEVLAYFAGRPEDLLVVETNKLGWGLLCQFLGKPVPAVDFPYENRAADREKKTRTLWKRLRRRAFSGEARADFPLFLF
jgi:hypothetical protein